MAVMTHASGGQSEHAPGRFRSSRPTGHRPRVLALPLLALAVAVALASVLAVYQHQRNLASVSAGVLSVYFLSIALGYFAFFAYLYQEKLSSRARFLCLQAAGLFFLMLQRSKAPTAFLRYDELLHQRTLADLLSTGRPFVTNPLLLVSPVYPGLEDGTALLVRLSALPTWAGMFLVVALARALLIASFQHLASSVLRSSRTASLASLLLFTSPQFFVFNAQFSYQTLAIGLAAAAVWSLRSAQIGDRDTARWRTAVAVVCLLATVVTHHLTSWITMAMLVVWLLTQVWSRRPRSRVVPIRAATVAMAIGLVAWTTVVGSRVAGYLGGIFSGAGRNLGRLVRGGGGERQLFEDGGGHPTPVVEQGVMLAAAGIWCLLIAASAYRLWIASRRGDVSALRLVPLGVAALYPFSLLGRYVPGAAEISDRSTTFLFFGMALVAAPVLVAAGRWRVRGRVMLRAALVTLVATVCFVGNVMLGSGPDWERLPGEYLVGADSRSVDSHVLAGAAWARDNLPPGSRVGADRAASAVLSAEAAMWPVTAASGGVNVGLLYFAPYWGNPQSEFVQSARIKYFWVDSRLSSARPRIGVYFEPGESPNDAGQLTSGELDKFADAPGSRVIYRAGPITIYDMAGLLPDDQQVLLPPSRGPLPAGLEVGIGIAVGASLVWLWWATAAARRRRVLDLTLLTAGVTSLLCLVALGLTLFMPLPTWRATVAGLATVLAASLWLRWRARRHPEPSASTPLPSHRAGPAEVSAADL